jgi:NAD(P)-dependent dehydrogenase (short-subunit alcohol dehydrogenase family)
MSLANKTILIIGGATGIGRATAEQCVNLGAEVLIADLHPANDWKGNQFQVDITNENSVKDLFSSIQSDYPRLDGLIQTAGILKGAYVPLDELDVATFREVLDVNVTGSFICVKYATPLLRKSAKAVVILLSSGAATGGSSSLAYGTSKGGVNGLFITLANRLAAEGIRVNVVSPGNIDTGMKRSVIAAEAEKQGKRLDAAIAESNLGTPDGVAKIIAWLVGDDADYVRGIINTR